MSAAPSHPSDDAFYIDEQRDSYYHNTRILATAVICLVIAITVFFFLHLYLRYFLYRRRLNAGRNPSGGNIFRFHITSATVPAVEQPSAGLEPAAIAALPTFPYRKSGADRDQGDSEGTECAVCLSAVEEGETVRLLPKCRHTFHVGCIDMWFGSHSTCPVCRAVVEPPPLPLSPSSSAVVHAGQPPASGHPRTTQDSGDGGASQEGAMWSKEAADSASASSPALRLSSSFRRMLSRERSSGRRVHADVADDLERQ